MRINDVNGAELYIYPHTDITYWNVTGIDEPQVNVLSVYPNPASDVINIALTAEANTEVTVDIMDINGRVVKSTILNASTAVNEARIEVGDVKPGIYIVRLGGSQTIATARVLIK